MADKHMKWCSTSLATQEMQIKIAMKCHYTNIRMAKVKKKSDSSKWWWEYGGIGSLKHCWWECKMVQPCWKRIWQVLIKRNLWTSLVVQWLRICLPMQRAWVQALVWEDPTCHRATKLMCHNYWARVPQLLKPTHLEPMLRNKEKPPQWEPHALPWRVAPDHRS